MSFDQFKPTQEQIDQYRQHRKAQPPPQYRHRCQPGCNTLHFESETEPEQQRVHRYHTRVKPKAKRHWLGDIVGIIAGLFGRGDGDDDHFNPGVS